MEDITPPGQDGPLFAGGTFFVRFATRHGAVLIRPQLNCLKAKARCGDH